MKIVFGLMTLLTPIFSMADWVQVEESARRDLMRSVNQQIADQDFQIGNCEVSPARMTDPKTNVTVGFFGNYMYKDSAQPRVLLVTSRPLENTIVAGVKSETLLYTDANDIQIIRAQGTDSEARYKNTGTTTNPAYGTVWVPVRSIECQ